LVIPLWTAGRPSFHRKFQLRWRLLDGRYCSTLSRQKDLHIENFIEDVLVVVMVVVVVGEVAMVVVVVVLVRGEN